jgi:ADP-ribose pyrophosphatase YjhB (NUDIX family)
MTGERAMITFNAGAWRFNYRVGGVIVRDGHVLLMRMGSENFWFVPGGRIEAAEPTKAALEREVAEELGVAG